MYEDDFELERRPFAATPNVACYVPNEAAESALAGLRRSVVDGGGIGVLTSAAGLGKSLLCRRLVADLPGEFVAAIVPVGSFDTRRALLQSLLFELGSQYTSQPDDELALRLHERLRELGRDGKRAVVVLDEADAIDATRLKEIRVFLEDQHAGNPLLSLVLAGTLTLEETLAEPGLEAVNQRITCHATLEPLDREESCEYVAGRIEWAGGDVETCFDEEALTDVARIADGSPRALNHLCDQALLLGHVDRVRPVDRSIVLTAYENLRHLPQSWNPPLVSDVRRTAEIELEGTTVPENVAPAQPEQVADETFEEAAVFEVGGSTTPTETRAEPIPQVPESVVEEPVADEPAATTDSVEPAVLEVGWAREQPQEEPSQVDRAPEEAPRKVAPIVEPLGIPGGEVFAKFDEDIAWCEEQLTDDPGLHRSIVVEQTYEAASAPQEPRVPVVEYDAVAAEAECADELESEPTTSADDRIDHPAEPATVVNVIDSVETDDTADVPADEFDAGLEIDPNDALPMLKSALEILVPREDAEPENTESELAVIEEVTVVEEPAAETPEPELVTEVDVDTPAETYSEVVPTVEVGTDPAGIDEVIEPDSEVIEPVELDADSNESYPEPSLEDDLALERQIEQSLREIARETAKAVGTIPDETEAPQAAEPADETVYDVVEPETRIDMPVGLVEEPAEPRAVEREDVAAAERTPAPGRPSRRYARLFSELREQHREASRR